MTKSNSHNLLFAGALAASAGAVGGMLVDTSPLRRGPSLNDFITRERDLAAEASRMQERYDASRRPVVSADVDYLGDDTVIYLEPVGGIEDGNTTPVEADESPAARQVRSVRQERAEALAGNGPPVFLPEGQSDGRADGADTDDRSGPKIVHFSERGMLGG